MPLNGLVDGTLNVIPPGFPEGNVGPLRAVPDVLQVSHDLLIHDGPIAKPHH